MFPVVLKDHLTPEHLLVPLSATDKRSAIIKLTATLARGEADHKLILEAVLAREEMLTTGIGHGVAVPHCRLEGERELRLAVGLAEPPIDWGGFDDRHVGIVFCLVGGLDDGGQLAELLGEISRLLGREENRRILSSATDAERLRRIVADFYRTD